LKSISIIIILLFKKEDLNDMCNLSQGIVERTTREVTENVTKTVTENVTKAVTENVTKEVTKTVTDKLNELNEKLLDDNRMDELARSFKDKELQDKLLVEYGLNEK
jgi:Cu/Ag efflux pump CusA